MKNWHQQIDQTSPANPNIVYTLEKAFEIIVMHEIRHLEQAKRVKEGMT